MRLNDATFASCGHRPCGLDAHNTLRINDLGCQTKFRHCKLLILLGLQGWLLGLDSNPATLRLTGAPRRNGEVRWSAAKCLVNGHLAAFGSTRPQAVDDESNGHFDGVMSQFASQPIDLCSQLSVVRCASNDGSAAPPRPRHIERYRGHAGQVLDARANGRVPVTVAGPRAPRDRWPQ